MGYAEEQQKMIAERAYGKQGIRTGTGHPENRRAVEDYERAQRTERRNREFTEWFSTSSSSYSDTLRPRSASSSSGGGLPILLALITLYYLSEAVSYIAQYTGSYERAMAVVGLLFLAGILCLWLLWKLLVRVLMGIVDVLGVIWDNRLGKICISTAMVAAGFYSANALHGDRGVVLFGQLILAGVLIWIMYTALKWFCRTLVGKILIRTAVLGGFIAIAWYLYMWHTS